METFELRYFLAVAKRQNIHQAADDIAISPGSLSKAVARLEDELSTQLFHRVGRNIELTEEGRILQLRATEIVRLEESAKLEIRGHHGQFQVVIAGSELVLSGIGFQTSATIAEKHPNAFFQFQSASCQDTIELINQGSAHLGLTTLIPPATLKNKLVLRTVFGTCVGKGHPLYRDAKAQKTVPIEQVLQHPFVCPSRGLLGRIQNEQASDGWREDVFPRTIKYVTSSLKLIEDFVVGGNAIAYLPDYLLKRMDVLTLKISGCPYECRQEIRLIAKNPKNVNWMNVFF